MTRGLSLYLDAARAFAAFAVLLSHLGYDFVSGGRLAWTRQYNIGSDAVVIFFVLSGLLISHTVAKGKKDFAAYAVARISRLWSVALPAIVLSSVLCVVGWSIAPDPYGNISGSELLHGIGRSVVFSNYLWFSATNLTANNPYWSVTYEFWYYAGFGTAMLLRDRPRLYGLTAIGLCAGPRILLLLPCWLMGVGLQKFLASEQYRRLGRTLGWGLLLLPLVGYFGLHAIDAPSRLWEITSSLIGGQDPNPVFGFSDEFLWNWTLAALTMIHFAGAALVTDSASDQSSWQASLPARTIRWLAGRTFSVYLFHMPILQLAVVLPGYDATASWHWVALGTVILVTSFALAQITEQRLADWRRVLGALLSGVKSRLSTY